MAVILYSILLYSYKSNVYEWKVVFILLVKIQCLWKTKDTIVSDTMSVYHDFVDLNKAYYLCHIVHNIMANKANNDISYKYTLIPHRQAATGV